ncbi:MAG TPA: ATP-binding protein [Blastocatellia bacterium]|nr:ATP-binding protein [Blastocatellia bacterium]
MPSFNLSIKLTICLIGGMVIIFSLFGYKIVRLHRTDLEEVTYSAGDRLSDAIRRSTRYGMLNNHSNDVRQIVKTMGSQPGISRIRIFNKAGEIKFSTDETEINTKVGKDAEACHSCHLHNQPLTALNRPDRTELSRSDRTRIFHDENGSRFLSIINPIENEPNCSNASCHAHSAETRILGVVDVAMSLEKVDEATAESGRQIFLLLLATILLLSFMVGALVWVMVHKPVSRLIVGTKKVASGDLDYKIKSSSQDEVGELAESFNRMTRKLKEANDEINDWARTLENRVEEKTGELSQAHAHILRVEKMASIGKLAAIVAHEINNPLAGILIYARLLLKQIDRRCAAGLCDEESRKHLETIAAESARCGEIVKGLLQFSRQTKANMEPSDINEVVLQSVRLVQHKIDLMNFRADVRLDRRLPGVICDSQQIKQALIALLINACEAMPQHEGVLTIESRWLDAIQSVEIIIKDNGIGMDEETRKHIFEPFFTTKEQGKGVGLGLSVVYGIVHGHSGEIDVDSSLGKGTTFIIRLPLRRAALAQEAGA